MTGILGAMLAANVWVGIQSFNLGTNSFSLNSNGTITPGANAAYPPQWFYPITTSIGSSYWINITRTGGNGGVNFSAAQGSWTAIGAGLSISAAGGAGGCQGTYQISTSVTGSPVVASGNVSVSNAF